MSEKIEEKVKKNETEDEKRKQKIYEIEKKLGRHNKDEILKRKRNNVLMKYFSIATNMIYTLSMPILLMLGVYLLLEKYVFKHQQPIVLIIFLIIGAFSGYWSLIKEINNIK